jgi:hypothetical protein
VPPVRCDAVSELLAAEPRAAELDGPARRHLDGCLRCQAEVVQYRKLLRALQALRTEVYAPAPGLMGEVLASLEHAGARAVARPGTSGRAVAYVGGLAVATAAGAGALVLASRGRGRRVRIAG